MFTLKTASIVGFNALRHLNLFGNSMKKFAHLLLAIVLVFAASCSSNKSVGKPKTNELNIPSKGMEFKLFQRGEIEIPSDSNNVFCAIDDITKGQCILTVRAKNKILLEQSIHEEQIIDFQYGSASYRIECTTLFNRLIGQDYAYFLLKRNSTDKKVASSTIESKKIEQFITKIEQSGIVFIRNETTYTSKEAADHLRSKWERSNGEIMTLNDFITQLATKSSVSGNPYQVKLPDGSIVNAADWYKEQHLY